MEEKEGKQMSLYGKFIQSPVDMAESWKNVLCRTENIRRNHLANKGDGSSLWPGIKQWSRNELEDKKDSYFGKRTRNTVVDTCSTYERLFHPSTQAYDSKIHRDDRNNTLKIGRAVYDEEKKRVLPLLSSSVYGQRACQLFEPPCRAHVRIAHIAQSFYRKRGTGLPPIEKP
ncbi:cilia- and flagella-associated protein 90-like [Ostrea edulis]|uniref:cilia- and flagella-associated protein 90-like n=1 Tax=Ostrea edulis TaxID=37623 RepID=UPI0024AEBCB9|nr:cilia- and flagella-associated protein 90-like [Ostrea edulis]